MSEENVEIVKRTFELFNQGEDDQMVDECYDPQAVYYSREDEPDTGVYRGRQAIRENFRRWREMFEDFRAEVDEYIDAGELVVTPGWLCGRGRDSGAEVREPYSWVARLRDGKIVEVREYRTKDEALEAAGLSG
jgi:ketosteroid isomerase-like protein